MYRTQELHNFGGPRLRPTAMIRNNQPGQPRFSRAPAFTILRSKVVLALHNFGDARVCRIQSAHVRPQQILLCHYAEGLAAFADPEGIAACSQQ